jgi:hypothetical protein
LQLGPQLRKLMVGAEPRSQGTNAQ